MCTVLSMPAALAHARCRLKVTVLRSVAEWSAPDFAALCQAWAQLGFLHEDAGAPAAPPVLAEHRRSPAAAPGTARAALERWQERRASGARATPAAVSHS